MPLQETPYWWNGLPPAPPFAAPLPAKADVVVVGSGYTGLSAALCLARGGASVLVLERDTVGFGASSRNGGQVLTGLKVGARELVRRYGVARAREMHGASLAAIAHLEALIAREGIDCGYRQCGHIEAAFKPAHFERFRRDQAFLATTFGHEVRLLERKDQGQELGTDYYHGILVDPRSGCLHPARYVRGLAGAAERAGARLREHCPVLEIRRGDGGFEVRCAEGSVAADAVLVATNGYTDLAPFRKALVPVGSYIVATEPLPDGAARDLLPRGRVAFDSKNFLFYFRLSDDSRLLFGGRAQWTPSTAESTRQSAAILKAALAQVWPGLRDLGIDWAWSGNVCFTPDLLPRATTLGGVHFAGGYAGHGVAMATYLGTLVGERLLGEPDRNPFRDLPWKAIPAYDGRPWFLPAVGAYYALQDRIS
jgi:glycine/D-amino acid oxidase-like deaminating enzyme